MYREASIKYVVSSIPSPILDTCFLILNTILMSILSIIQISIAAILTACILMQQRGTGAGSAIIGEGGGATYFRKRGVEKILSWLTVIFAAAFLVISLIRIAA